MDIAEPVVRQIGNNAYNLSDVASPTLDKMGEQVKEMLVAMAEQLRKRDQRDVISAKDLDEAWYILFHQPPPKRWSL